jgi:hypothetical protein
MFEHAINEDLSVYRVVCIGEVQLGNDIVRRHRGCKQSRCRNHNICTSRYRNSELVKRFEESAERGSQ